MTLSQYLAKSCLYLYTVVKLVVRLLVLLLMLDSQKMKMTIFWIILIWKIVIMAWGFEHEDQCDLTNWVVAICGGIRTKVSGLPDMVITDGGPNTVEGSPRIVVCRSNQCKVRTPGMF